MKKCHVKVYLAKSGKIHEFQNIYGIKKYLVWKKFSLWKQNEVV
jgi:hypothetical protein